MLGKKSVEQINAKISSIIGADMVVDGNIRAKEAVRVEGAVNGDVETEGALIISSSGKVKGNVKGSSIVIGGSLEGDLTSSGRTEVASTGKVIGNIRTKSLVVDENGVFQGQCIMNAEGIGTLPKPSVNTSVAEKQEQEQEQDAKKDSTNNNNKWNKR
ncbi:MAG: polymer-forming cytoskeletal protein [Lachnospiraceae bacterium]|nr:polymer-forming cytoskeletal protein [Lachnospiraceae bacterium]MDE7360146.1 polymer-forming cytoskeletal protein [Lachnospiraceae bacterium]